MCLGELEMLPTQIFKYSFFGLACQQTRIPQHWYELIKKLRQNCWMGEIPSQGTHFIKSFLIPLPLSGGAGSPLHINPCCGDTVADIWDSNQETYFFGIECPLSSCTASIVGKSELLLLGFFGGFCFSLGFLWGSLSNKPWDCVQRLKIYSS